MIDALITPAQLRAARALLDWPAKMLGDPSYVSLYERQNFKNNNVTDARVQRWRDRLEAAGVEFIPGGARLRETTR